jgi:hypothetical protein
MHSWALASLVFRLAGQFRVRQAASDDLLHDASKSLRVRHTAIVVAEGLLIKVAEEMKWLNADVGAMQSALEQAPEVFHRVRVNVLVDVLDSVIDNRMLKVAFESVVRLQFISENRAASLYMLAHLFLKFMLAAIIHDLQANIAAAFYHTHDSRLVFAARARDLARTNVLVHVPRFAADKSFVDLNFAAELVKSSFLHRQTNAVEHEPSCLLCDAKAAMEFVATDSVLATDNQPRGGQPLLKRNRRVFKNGAGLQGKRRAFMFAVAFPYACFCQPRHVVRSTLLAFHYAIGPAEFHHELPAVLEIREPQNRLVDSVWRFHEPSMKQNSWYVKYIIALNWRQSGAVRSVLYH